MASETLIGVNNNCTYSGLYYTVYNGYMNDNVIFFKTASLLPPGTSGTSGSNNKGLNTNISSIVTGTNGFINSTSGNPDNFSVQWLGYFKSNYTGIWTFSTNSDDCSYLWIGSNAISGYTIFNALVNNRGTHAPTKVSATINLTSGTYYPIRIQYGDATVGHDMIVTFKNPNLTETSNGNGYYYSINNNLMKA